MIKKKSVICLVVSILIVAVVAPTAIVGVALVTGGNDLEIAIISDIHVLSEEQIGDKMSASLQAQERKGQKILSLSESILKTAIDEVIDGGQEVLLIAGDLTDDGSLLAHEAVAKQLKRAEANDVECFVINGNHDINNKASSYIGEEKTRIENVNAEKFSEIYADYGYKDAISRHEESLSYSANLNGKYRLIAIDCSFYEINTEDGFVEGRNTSKVTEGLINWAADEVKKAIESGKTPIGMMHFPITSHLTSLIQNDDVMAAEHESLSLALAEAGLNIIFTGHLHSQDIAKVDTGKGVLYDVETGSLCNYPLPIRTLSCTKEKFLVTTSYLTAIKEKYIPSFLTAELRKEVTEDFVGYTERVVENGMKNKVAGKVDISTIVTLLGYFNLDKKASETLALAQSIYDDVFMKFLDMPLYGEGGLQEICSKYGIALPETEYRTVWGVFMELLKANYMGNEKVPEDSSERLLVKYSLYAAFYTIADFDFFGKINALNEENIDIDLMSDMEALFADGGLEIVDNDLLSALLSLAPIQRVLGKLPVKINTEDSAAALEMIKSIFSLSETLDMAKILGDNAAMLADILALRPQQFIDFDKGELLIGDLVDNGLFGELGANLVTDVPPDDQRMVVFR